MLPAFRLLAGMKGLRGGVFDPFSYNSERKMERALITQYERDMTEVLEGLTPARLPIAIKLAELPLEIRGFGPVKAANAEKAAARRLQLLAEFRAGGAPQHPVSLAAR